MMVVFVVLMMDVRVTGKGLGGNKSPAQDAQQGLSSGSRQHPAQRKCYFCRCFTAVTIGLRSEKTRSNDGEGWTLERTGREVASRVGGQSRGTIWCSDFLVSEMVELPPLSRPKQVCPSLSETSGNLRWCMPGGLGCRAS
jgi:hypothetical protein